MKKRIREIIAVFALLVCGALMLSGCPATPEPGPGPGPAQQYEIRFRDNNLGEGKVSVNPPTYLATSGSNVTITLIPNAGYEPYNLSVYDSGNRQVSSLAQSAADPYIYTFTMPASIVWIGVNFLSIYDVIDNERLALTASANLATWDRIAALNALIKKAPDQTHQAVKDAIQRLEGNPDLTNYPKPPYVVTTAPPLYGGPAGSSYYQGIIRAKIRDADLKDRISPLTWPREQDSILKGVYNTSEEGTDTINGTSGFLSDSLGIDKTYLFYIKGDAAIPPFSPEKGWDHTNPVSVAATDFAFNLVENLDAVQEILLTYKIGINPANSVRYKVWLVPVAQFTVEYDPGTTSAVVTIYNWEYDDNEPDPNKKWREIPASQIGGGPKTLSSNNQQVTSNVGKAAPANSTPPTYPTDTGIVLPPNAPTSGTPPAPDRMVFVDIRPNRTGVRIDVYSGNALVSDIYGNELDYISSTTPGLFYPESRNYTLKVRSVTPPQGMQP